MARTPSNSKSVTLMDVAKAAGVATVTVSRCLNQHPSVSESTAKKVRAAVKKLGYSPNLAARMLMGQPSNAIGLIVPNLADFFYGQVAHSIQEEARNRGLLVWIAASNSDQGMESVIINQMKQHKVDGILLIPADGDMLVRKFDQGPPLVMLDKPVLNSVCDTVIVENRKASHEAVEHLLWHGYKRIVCISGEDPAVYTHRERIAGYEDAMRSHQLPVEVISRSKTVGEIHEVIRAAMNKSSRLDAIFTTNNVTTIHAMEALAGLRIQIPKGVALIGFDDFELASLTRPSVTVVSQPGAELGKQAARLLFQRMLADEDTKEITIALQATLIIRESCGCKRKTFFRKDTDVSAQATSPRRRTRS
jgi:LacI family transcriptional regulator